jgi:hypothetical protein
MIAAGHQLGRNAGEVAAQRAGDGLGAAQVHRQAQVTVLVGERRLPVQAAGDVAGGRDSLPLGVLSGRRGDRIRVPGEVGDGGRVVGAEHLRPSWHLEFRCHPQPPGPGGFQAEGGDERAGYHARGPHRGVAGQFAAVGQPDCGLGDLRDPGAQPRVDPALPARAER